MNKLIKKWHDRLDMPKHNLDWHKRDVKDEMKELAEASGIIHNWSELSDISYTYTRALWSGHNKITLPISRLKYYIGIIYMFPKYRLRWNFFYQLGQKLNSKIKVREVRNPKKVNKLETIAEQYGFDKELFVKEAKEMLKGRFFLK